MSFLYKLLSGLISVVFFISSIFSFGITPKDKKNIRLCMGAISDTHLLSDDVSRVTALGQGLKNLSDEDVDAVLVAGDITNHGEPEQFEMFYGCVKDYYKGKNLIPCVGNHDTWTTDAQEGHYTDAYIKAYNEYFGTSLNKPYYTRVVNGYTIICLSSEGDSVGGRFSVEQAEWLDEQLALATADGKPAFVLCHWLINDTNGAEILWPEKSFIGENSDVYRAVLEKYDNVFYITGHVHAGLRGETAQSIYGHSSIETENGVTYVNLPCYMYWNTEGIQVANMGYPLGCCGYIIEVYDNCVLFRARNIAMQHWLPAYNYQIDLV